jgi:hypothetical protein
MGWSKKEMEYGVIKTEGKSIKVHTSQTSHYSVYIGENIRDVRWNGDVILVTLESGRVRRYTSQTSFNTI